MTSRIFTSTKVLFVRVNLHLVTLTKKFGGVASNSSQLFFRSSVVEKNNIPSASDNINTIKMPIIAAVVAHRNNHKQPPSNSVMTKHFFNAKMTPPTRPTPVKCVNMCSFRLVNSNFENNKKLRPAIQCQPTAPFSTSSKSLKSKITEVFSFNFCNRILFNSDHEESRRFYAKGRISTNKKTLVIVKEDEMAELIDVEAYKSQLDELSEQMKDDFTKQLSVRNAAGALELLQVEFDGETYPLQELAQVGRRNPQLAVLNLSSLPDACQAVVKAIQESGMNLNPQQEGTTIYVPLPKVTREHRENLARNAKTLFTKYKTAYQTVQNRYIKQCRTRKEGFSEDLVFNVQKQIMKIASDYITEAEKLVQTKQKELLQQDK